MSTPTSRDDEGPLEPPSDGGQPLTSREDGAGGAPTTSREGPAPMATASPSILPPELSSRYRFVSQLSQVGAEGTLFSVDEVDSGTRRILKLYHGNVELRPEALERIQRIDHAHVVQLISFGQLADGRWYEVQEHVGGGDLVQYRNQHGGHLVEAQLRDVIAELSSALDGFHGAGLAHHDIKPENVLVRGDDPLDLVLSDFGLSVVAGDRTHYASNRNATVTYQAPEILQLVGGEPRDHWALGLTIAMLATGEVPYQGLNEHAILHQHVRQVPPAIIEDMPDGRVKELCRGLTRYDTDRRWGHEEIVRWLDGDDPVVHPERPGGGGLGVSFNQRTFDDPRALAEVIVDNWPVAVQTIGVASRREPFMDELILRFGTDPLAELDARWRERAPSKDHMDAAVVELIVALDPDRTPRFRGRLLTPETLVAAAQEREGSEGIELVDQLRSRQVLEAWSQGSAGAELGAIAERWRAYLTRYEALAGRARRAGATPPPVEVAARPLLELAAMPTRIEHWMGLRADARPRTRSEHSWYDEIAEDSNRQPADVVTAYLLADEVRCLQDSAEAAARERAADEARRRWRLRGERANRVLAWLPLVAVAAGLALESWTTGSVDGQFPLGRPLLDLSPALVVQVGAVVLQWVMRNRDPRRSELLGVVAALAGAHWSLSVRPDIVGLELGTSPGGRLGFAVVAFGSAAAAALVASATSLLRRRNDQGAAEVPLATDQRTVRRTVTACLTLVVPGGVGLALLARQLGGRAITEDLDMLFRASASDVLIASVARGLAVPLAVGGVLLLTRGRWSRRRYGAAWGAGFLVAGLAAWPAGASVAEGSLDSARDAMRSTPVPAEAVPGGEFCGQFWTRSARPVRTFVAGPRCLTLYQYVGWFESWSLRIEPENGVDDLLAIDNTYLVITNDETGIIGVSDDGEPVWLYGCGSAVEIDESQLDQGSDTPEGQVVAGTCAGEPFRLDPATGQSV